MIRREVEIEKSVDRGVKSGHLTQSIGSNCKNGPSQPIFFFVHIFFGLAKTHRAGSGRS